MNITYRHATITDAINIAQLHAHSWQQHYAGIWQDEYLNGPVVSDRLKVWEQRLQSPTDYQQIILAESEDSLVGFACIFIKKDAVYGTLLDNLHVLSQFQGHGIGKQLMLMVATAACVQAPQDKFFLWVLEENHAARKFYERLNGVFVETISMENPDGTFSPACRCVWVNPKVLLDR